MQPKGESSKAVNQLNNESPKEPTPPTHQPTPHERQSSSSDDEYSFMVESTLKVSAPFVSLKVNGVVCKFLVDSGASVNIISPDMHKMLNVKLDSCDTKVYAFNSSDPLPVLGKFTALIESKCSSMNSEFLVVNDKTSLLGYTAATKLGILQIANAVTVDKNVFCKYPSLFCGLGKMR